MMRYVFLRSVRNKKAQANALSRCFLTSNENQLHLINKSVSEKEFKIKGFNFY